MERRILPTILVCIGIVLVWNLWIDPPKPPAPRPKVPATPSSPTSANSSIQAPPEKPAEMESAFKHQEPAPEVEAPVLQNSSIRVVFDSTGATIREVALLTYLEAGTKTHEPVRLLAPRSQGLGHAAVTELREDGALPEMAERRWERVTEDAAGVTYRYLHPTGIEVTKRFTLQAESHVVRMTLSLSNKNSTTQKLRLRLRPIDGLSHDGNYQPEAYARGFVGRRIGEDRKVEEVAALALKDGAKGYEAKDIDWVGARNRYFTAVFGQTGESGASPLLSDFRLEARDERGAAGKQGLWSAACIVDTAPLEIEANVQRTSEFFLYAGPVRKQELLEAPRPLGSLFDYSGFNFVASIIVWLLEGLEAGIGNWGFAIILTTLLIRLVLFPLSRKSQVSAFRMQQLQPKMQILRDRYKQDMQKMNQETWKLYREHKINPMSGCFPVLLQFPVWIGMFAVYNESIALRQAPFIFWIRDLSQPDSLVTFSQPVSILFFTLQGLNVLPILMMATSFLQFYYAPKSPDPQMRSQQKMMMVMFPIMGVMFYNYAAGLSLYFVINSLFAMAEQKIIKKFFLKPVEPAV